MKLSDFMYDLPEELIAQTPVEPRDHSRLMVIDRKSGNVEHKHFYDIIDYLNPGDVLVVNETRVIPARLIGNRPTGGTCEILLLKQLAPKKWEAIVRPGKKPLSTSWAKCPCLLTSMKSWRTASAIRPSMQSRKAPPPRPLQDCISPPN